MDPNVLEFLSSKKFIGVAATLVAVLAIVLVRQANLPLPDRVVLAVPFTDQAPTGNWDRNEDCEETSLSMANAFLNGQRQDRMSAKDAQSAIANLKKWEGVNIGYNANTGADATMQMAQGAFGILVDQIKDFSEKDLKVELAKNHAILLPIDARLLNNPKYLNGGPLYHMIVVRGYHGDTFIVNDPGTGSGDGNEYTFDVLKNASADWDQTAKAMDPTRKIALVLSK